MNALPGFDNWLSEPYDNFDPDAQSRAEDAIYADQELIELAILAGDVEPAEAYPALLVTLWKAGDVIDKLMHGDSLDVATACADQLEAWRDICRAADNARKYVTDCVSESAAS